MNPNNRTLIKISIKNKNYIEKLISILMGDNIKERKLFIKKYYNYNRININY